MALKIKEDQTNVEFFDYFIIKVGIHEEEVEEEEEEEISYD